MKRKTTILQYVQRFCNGTSGEVTKGIVSVSSASFAAAASIGLLTTPIPLTLVAAVGIVTAIFNSSVSVLGNEAKKRTFRSKNANKELQKIHEKLQEIFVLVQFIKDILVFAILYYVAKEILTFIRILSPTLAFIIGIVIAFFLVFAFAFLFRSAEDKPLGN